MNDSKKILIFGGEKDFNIMRLLKHAHNNDIKLELVLISNSGLPKQNYDFEKDLLFVDNKIISANGAFLRFDVFQFLESNNPNDQDIASNWYDLISGWLQAHSEIKIFNRNFTKKTEVNKFKTLLLAKSLEIKIPETHICNDFEILKNLPKSKKFIYKPLQGGDHTKELDYEFVTTTTKKLHDYPFIVQEKLINPEMRVFRIHDQCFGFLIKSDHLDYRTDKSPSIELTQISEELSNNVMKLTDTLGLDFSALDFKTCPHTGEMVLLEANSSPMFAAFDQIADGKICQAIFDYLLV
jgi:glutathione synthase/RimK-type ligase-like ATP-grasp enzyme